MSRRNRRNVDIFNLSFLDVVSCGFGAIILLLVIVKISEPHVIELLAVDLNGLVARLEAVLRVRLLERTTRKLRLTEAGTAAYARCQAMCPMSSCTVNLTSGCPSRSSSFSAG